MKKLLNFIVCSTAILALSSCSFFENEESPKNRTEVSIIKELPDSLKKKIVEQDALMTELLNKVDTLTAELNTIKTENAELKEKLAELKSPRSIWAYVSICAFILGLIALIMALFKPKGIKEQKVYDIVKKCLDDSRRIKELQVQVKNLLSLHHNNRTSQSGSSYEIGYDARLRRLESQISRVVAVLNTNKDGMEKSVTQPSTDIHKPHREPEYQKIGYAKNDKDMYFTTIYDSNQEGCVFEISFTSPSKGKFNIISLDKIQSRNDWQQKVECSGISIKEASDFLVEDDGICEKIDENTWQVTKPLKIRLLK